jgi:hypothetical protein
MVLVRTRYYKHRPYGIKAPEKQVPGDLIFIIVVNEQSPQIGSFWINEED